MKPWLCLCFFMLSISLPAEIHFRFNRPPFSQSLDEDMRQALQSARPGAELDLLFYELRSPAVVDGLCQAVERGAKARVILDFEEAMRLKSGRGPDLTPIQAVARLKECGVLVISDRNFHKGSAKSHNKLLLLDPDHVFTGSWNATSAGLWDSENQVIHFKGRQVYQALKPEIDRLFMGGIQTEGFTTTQWIPLAMGRVRFCLSPHPACFQMVREVLAGAESSIELAMFSLTHPEILEILAAKAAQGIRVQVTLDSMGAGARARIQDRGSETVSEWLKSRGVIIHIPSGKGLMHHKSCVIDSNLIVTGSLNWSDSGFFRNDENVFFISGSAWVDKYRQAGFSAYSIPGLKPLSAVLTVPVATIEEVTVSGKSMQVRLQGNDDQTYSPVLLQGKKRKEPIWCKQDKEETYCFFEGLSNANEALLLLQSSLYRTQEYVYFRARKSSPNEPLKTVRSALFSDISSSKLEYQLADGICLKRTMPGMYYPCNI